MNTTIATSDARIASLPVSTVTPPSVGLMICSLIGFLSSSSGKLPAFKNSKRRVRLPCRSSIRH